MKANFGVTPTAGSTRGVMFAPDLQGEELRMLNEAPGDSVNTLSHGQVDDVAGLPSQDTHFADTIRANRQHRHCRAQARSFRWQQRGLRTLQIPS